MADKEATVYIVDLGSSMADCHNGRIESDMSWSMQYVWDRISTTVAANRKTWNIGVVGLKTDETDNPLAEEDGYNNISVLRGIGPMGMAGLRSLQEKIQPSSTDVGDCLSAIVIAMEMIQTFTKKLKYNRRIFLVTNGESPLDEDEEAVAEIAARIKDLGIELTVLGVDFDDSEFGFKEEDKTEQKAANEASLKQLTDACDGQFGTIAEAIAELSVPRLKPVKPYKSYEGPLTLGDPQQGAMSIDVERYFKTHKATIPPASNVVLQQNHATRPGDDGAMEGIQSTGGDFAAVSTERTYKVNDPEKPQGKREVEFEDLAKGYEYGRTAVHISESEHNITKIETTKGFSIIGFIPQDNFEPFVNMGDSCMIVPQKFNDEAAIKLSSFIHSLHELESYAIARLVMKDGKEPLLLILAPHIDLEFECLYDVPLPFAEDVRSYRFPPLDKVVTVTGKVLNEHRQLPSHDLLETMSEYVDAMDISTYEMDDDGNRTQEYAPVDDLYCPTLHRINQAVRHRAIYPDQPVPPIPPILVKYAKPDEELEQAAKSRLDDLIETAEVKKVPPKATGRRQRDKVVPRSGLDIDALLKQPEHKRAKIDSNNAIPEFRQILNTSDSEDAVKDAAKQMGQIIRGLISDSMGDLNYERVIEDLGVLREGMVDFEFADLFNTFLLDLKKKILSGELGGDRRELWWMLKGKGLGLIDNLTVESSNITPEEAAEFYKK
ncbi:SPOC like C-terminal domain-containing protein [Apiospora rasikravindrae]|uniref:ATP-dependent DNA helicase II subunit 2 n=1 Tax=Apiospora rasikravindrae TaxID=990691 RepID=A0ABR1U9A4_9PEZI